MKLFERKRVALDFDDTFTTNEDVWSDIVNVLLLADFDVRFVTFRFDTDRNEDIRYWSRILGIEIIFCNGVQKSQVCGENRWVPDIWIDDMPVTIPMKQQLQGMILGIEKNGG